MKPIRALILLGALLQAALPTLSPASSSSYLETDFKKLEEAALALSYRARLVSEECRQVAWKSPNPNLGRADRLAQQVRSRAVSIAEVLSKKGDKYVIENQLKEIEPLVFQLDAVKRDLMRTHREERQLHKHLSDVRRNYFYLKQLLTGKA